MSNTPTCGVSGMRFKQALIPLIIGGPWSGLIGLSSSSSFIARLSIIADFLYFSPPWAIRCPTAPISEISLFTPYSRSVSTFNRSSTVVVGRQGGLQRCNSPFPAVCEVILTAGADTLANPFAITDRSCILKSWYFKETNCLN